MKGATAVRTDFRRRGLTLHGAPRPGGLPFISGALARFCRRWRDFRYFERSTSIRDEAHAPVRRVEIALGREGSETIVEVVALRSQQWRIGQLVGLRPRQYRLFPSQ